MAITRLAVSHYLSSQFSAFASEIGQTLTDDGPNGYGPDIDNALRELDTDEGDLSSTTIADTLRRSYLTLAEYYAARRMWVRMGAKATSRLGPASVDYRSTHDAIKAIMEDAAARAAALGYGLDADTSWSFGRLGLDFLEPAEEQNA